MRLLTVSNTPFPPATAGNRQRLNQLLAYLAAHGLELGMLMLPAADGVSWDLTGMRERVAYFELAAPLDGPLPRALARLGRAARGLRPTVRRCR